MPIRCPFCAAKENGRIEGTDESGNDVVLLMFDCPFSFKLPQNLMGPDDSIQSYLDDWKTKNGEAWLEGLGTVMKGRELNNMEQKQKTRGGRVLRSLSFLP